MKFNFNFFIKKWNDLILFLKTTKKSIIIKYKQIYHKLFVINHKYRIKSIDVECWLFKNYIESNWIMGKFSLYVHYFLYPFVWCEQSRIYQGTFSEGDAFNWARHLYHIRIKELVGPLTPDKLGFDLAYWIFLAYLGSLIFVVIVLLNMACREPLENYFENFIVRKRREYRDELVFNRQIMIWNAHRYTPEGDLEYLQKCIKEWEAEAEKDDNIDRDEDAVIAEKKRIKTIRHYETGLYRRAKRDILKILFGQNWMTARERLLKEYIDALKNKKQAKKPPHWMHACEFYVALFCAISGLFMSPFYMHSEEFTGHVFKVTRW